MLDNFELEAMRETVPVHPWQGGGGNQRRGQPGTVKAIAETGVDYISVGERPIPSTVWTSFQGDDLALNPVTMQADGDSADKTLVILRHAAKPSVVSYPCVVPATGDPGAAVCGCHRTVLFNRDLSRAGHQRFLSVMWYGLRLTSPPSCTSTCSSLQVISFQSLAKKLRDTSSSSRPSSTCSAVSL